jgi:hypothetical protein
MLYTLRRVLGISNRSSFHQSLTECIFGFENGPAIETVSSVTEILTNSHSDRALVYCIWRRAVASHWLHYGVRDLLWVFIKHQIMAHVLNFLVDVILILTDDLGSTDQTVNHFRFHVMWVIGLKSRWRSVWIDFRCTFVANVGPLIIIKTSKNWRVSLFSTSILILLAGLTLLRWWRNYCNLIGPCDQTTKVSSTYLSHLAGLWSAVSNAISSKRSTTIIIACSPVTRQWPRSEQRNKARC